VTALAIRLDDALLALSAGNRRSILELVRDEPAAVTEMAEQFGIPASSVSQDISMLQLAEYEEQHDALAARYDRRLLAAARLEPRSEVLDVGCGTGVSTRQVARIVTPGRVVGVDLSGPMIRKGRVRSRAEGLANVAYEEVDAQTHPFEPASFDVVLSRFGATYFTDPPAAFANLAAALRPGGRLALVAWQGLERNPWMSAVREAVTLGRPVSPLPAGTPGAFGLAERDVVVAVLAGAGFAGVEVEDVAEQVTFGPDVDRAFDFVSTLGFAKDGLAHLQGRESREALARLRATLDAAGTGEGVWFPSRAWIVTATRP
jgi:SAM-dependent methyltransferase